MTESRIRVLANAVGAVGAGGQAILLFHSLADCYPYKMMSHPPGWFYESIAYAGAATGPAIAGLVCWAVSVRSVSYVPALACLPTPAVFLLPPSRIARPRPGESVEYAVVSSVISLVRVRRLGSRSRSPQRGSARILAPAPYDRAARTRGDGGAGVKATN